ncbi:fibroblast growth factor-binding protein 1-like [Misgurnus anguillicaudatus]|uniref:fibroblast growth factor-binding protein 1-like n=1 Tax=Misgurnus anguillicaudatus TaxID=75329 RepID=UPI003CCFD201
MRLEVALVLIFACVATLFLQADGVIGKEKKARPPGEKIRGEKRDKSAPKGRFSLKEGTNCTWVAARKGDRFILGVTCKNARNGFECEYVGKPSSCLQYSSNTKVYWKQINRSLKKHKRLCRDNTALVKARVCRTAPEDAHFRMMRARSAVPSPLSGSPVVENDPCPGRMDRQKLADEYCTNSWSSLCTFLFLMVENDECA